MQPRYDDMSYPPFYQGDVFSPSFLEKPLLTAKSPSSACTDLVYPCQRVWKVMNIIVSTMIIPDPLRQGKESLVHIQVE